MSVSGFPDWNPKPVQSFNIPQQSQVSIPASKTLTVYSLQFTAQFSGLISVLSNQTLNVNSSPSQVTITLNVSINNIVYYSNIIFNNQSGSFSYTLLNPLINILPCVAGDVINISFSVNNGEGSAITWQLNNLRVILL